MKTCLPAGRKQRHKTCLKNVSSISSRHVFKFKKDVHYLGSLYVFAKFLQRHVFYMSSHCIRPYWPCIVLYILSNGKIIFHVERSHLFLNAQLQHQPIQLGAQVLYELWIACVCHHINNRWWQEMAGLFWFFKTTTDVVQTTTPNLLTTRDI